MKLNKDYRIVADKNKAIARDKDRLIILFIEFNEDGIEGSFGGDGYSASATISYTERTILSYKDMRNKVIDIYLDTMTDCPVIMGYKFVSVSTNCIRVKYDDRLVAEIEFMREYVHIYVDTHCSDHENAIVLSIALCLIAKSLRLFSSRNSEIEKLLANF